MRNKQHLLITLFSLCFSLGVLHAQWSETGTAAYYADKLHGKKTTSGELYDKYALTAAHHNLPIGTRIRVTRLDNQKSVEVRINDCCLPVKGRIVDLSRAAAEQIDLIKAGTAQVRIDLMVMGDGKTCGKGSQPVAYSAEAEKVAVKGSPSHASVAPGTYRAEALKPIESGFGVQVGAFSDKANADAKVEELKKKGFKDILVTFAGAGAKIPYKVVIGPFEKRESAAAYQKSLATKHKIKGVVVDLAGQ